MKKNHELVAYPNGQYSMRDLATGECMHSSIGPWEEAEHIHVDQSDLTTRLFLNQGLPLVIYDVGMGLATNALAALEAHRCHKSDRPLHLISFENDPSALEMALQNLDRFDFLKSWETVLRELLERSFWKSSNGKVHWELRRGDFESHALFPKPEICFFDFYSPKSQPHLWNVDVFSRLHRSMGSVPQLHPILTTYSAATSVRVALLLAGYSVGIGRETSKKRETTLATLSADQLKRPLGGAWLERLMRSEKCIPHGHSLTKSEVIEKIRNLEQFKFV